MPARTSTLAALAVLASVGFAAGCGSDDDAGSTGSDAPATATTAVVSISEAKATLSKDCQQGKASDKPLCDCIADELAKAGNDAAEILAINKQVNGGDSPAAVTTAATACARFAAP
jgi:hypothetical protein